MMSVKKKKEEVSEQMEGPGAVNAPIFNIEVLRSLLDHAQGELGTPRSLGSTLGEKEQLE